MSAGKIDTLLKLMATLYDTQPPFTSHQELYMLIDAIKQGDIPWNSFLVAYNGTQPSDRAPRPLWMDERYEVWFRDPLQVLKNQVANPDFKDTIDFSPKQVYHNGMRQYNDLMSGNWAWDQVVSWCTFTPALANIVCRTKLQRTNQRMELCSSL